MMYQMMIRRCAWCGCELGEKPAEGVALKYGNQTDGMCDECEIKFRKEYDDYKKRMLAQGTAPNLYI